MRELSGTAGTVDFQEENGMDVMGWLTDQRKLDATLLERMGVKEVQHPGMASAVAFPYRRGGEVYAAKFRSTSKKDWRSTKDVSRGLYNEDALKALSGALVITEGEMDCLSIMQAGWAAVSLPDGWTEGGDKRECLIYEEARLRQSEYVIVAGDNDDAGASLPKTVANILEGHDVRVVQWPEGSKDANDVLVKHGEAAIVECLRNAKKVDPEGGFITALSDLPPLPARRVLRVGMKPFDWVIAFEVGAMSVGTGTPGSGKSTFTTFAAYHVAKSENIRVGLLSFETHPHRTRDHLSRLHTQKPFDELAGPQKQEALRWMDNHFRIVHRVFDGNAQHHLGWLKSMVYTLAVRDNCKLIVIDPWNELEHLPEKGESMTAYINFALQQIRVWAEQYDVHICLVAHPRKMPTDRVQTPTGYDVADSAAFANKPSLGFTVLRNEDDSDPADVEVHCWKVRDAQLYGIDRGSASLRFLPATQGYVGV